MKKILGVFILGLALPALTPAVVLCAEETVSTQEALEKGQAAEKNKNDEEAEKWYRQAAEQGNVEGQYRLSFSLYSRAYLTESYLILGGKDKNYTRSNAVTWLQQAVEWAQKSAAQDYAPACGLLGAIYRSSDFAPEVPGDKKESHTWYQKGAELGDADSQYALGDILERGDGIPADKEQAASWYQKAADQGNAKAKQALYELNMSKKQDSSQAPGKDDLQKADDCEKAHALDPDCDHLYWVAAKKGNIVAMYKLSSNQINIGNTEELCIQLGGCQGKAMGNKNPHIVSGLYWLRKAADLSYADAEYDLGLQYDKGTNIDKDPEKAKYWYQKAADQGDVEAQGALSKLNAGWN